eukprot:Phypoly_transcript_09125.p1 GENE.Phypoly_transcript_09125~~Phypoly_transcript_09125.p1  ORF type:complete len:403 (+),score=48.23 Phypoly_transcript_09125:165-1373(+)
MSLSHPYTRKACASCIELKAKCTHTRPCERCVNRGVLCSDVVRKPRLKNSNHSEIMPFLSTIPPRYTPSSSTRSPRTPPNPSPSASPRSRSPPATSPGSASPPISPTATPPAKFPIFPPTPPSPAPCTPVVQDEIVELENYLIGMPDNCTIACGSTPRTPSEQVCPSSPAFHPASPSQTTISVLLNAVKPVQTDMQTTKAAAAVVPILDALMNLVNGLEKTREQNEQVVTEVKALKKLIDGFLPPAQQALPKEIHIDSATFILDPQTLRMRDCNESFLQLFGGVSKKKKLLNANVKMAFQPFLRQMVSRDFEWFMKNKIAFAERYMIIPLTNKSVLYALGTFQVLSPNYAVITLSAVYEGTPRCLQVTYNHYLGLNEPLEYAPECTRKYCHCKLLNLPLQLT